MGSRAGARYVALGACARRGVRPAARPCRRAAPGGPRVGGSPKPWLTFWQLACRARTCVFPVPGRGPHSGNSRRAFAGSAGGGDDQQLGEVPGLLAEGPVTRCDLDDLRVQGCRHTTIAAWPADSSGTRSGSIVAGVSQAPGTMMNVDKPRSSGGGRYARHPTPLRLHTMTTAVPRERRAGRTTRAENSGPPASTRLNDLRTVTSGRHRAHP